MMNDGSYSYLDALDESPAAPGVVWPTGPDEHGRDSDGVTVAGPTQGNNAFSSWAQQEQSHTVDPSLTVTNATVNPVTVRPVATNPVASRPLQPPSPTPSGAGNLGPGVPGVPDALAQHSSPAARGPPKVGTRFSSGSVRLLKTWFTNHEQHAYPTPDDLETLQSQTGLTRQQITTWLANARRRAKFRPSRSSSPFIRSHGGGAAGGGLADASPSSSSPQQQDQAFGPVDIPPRRPTPAPFFDRMDPLERWKNSPPEHEAAAVSDISRAVAAASSSLLPSASGRSSGNASSASSAGTWSHSSRGSGSRGSAAAFSHTSRNSFGSSFDSARRNAHHHRRRRRANPKRQHDRDGGGGGLRPTLFQSYNTYQCTFCTETFKTKYDWQRHEKALHLSLEEWVCSPNGPTVASTSTSPGPEESTGIASYACVCVYCGEKAPDQAHLDRHNFAACVERPLEERTFYRKDHLQQHLKLVHNARFAKPMEQWRVTSKEVRSRCGFCGAGLDTWNKRADHLAEHFKAGRTMADWKGDWGFDAQTVEMLDNAMPPYLIHFEQISPLPFSATHGPADTPTSAYDLIKLELEYYMTNYYDLHGHLPADDNLHYECCSIVFGAEILSHESATSAPSWLRDLLVLSSPEIVQQARLRPHKRAAKWRMTQLQINGKDNIFEQCELEATLQRNICLRRQGQVGLGVAAGQDMVVSDVDLQREACNVLAKVEATSLTPSSRFMEFLQRLAWGSTEWLEPTRQRGQQLLEQGGLGLGGEEFFAAAATMDMDLSSGFMAQQDNAEVAANPQGDDRGPTVAHAQGAFNPSSTLYPIWPAPPDFNAAHTYTPRPPGLSTPYMPSPTAPGTANSTPPAGGLDAAGNPVAASLPFSAAPGDTGHAGHHREPGFGLQNTTRPVASSNHTVKGLASTQSPRGTNAPNGMPFLLNDINRYRRLARELARFVTTTMSPNNPNCHVPTDDELNYQARWILYDDDDPWNQTPVDNKEWLREFKRDVGLLTDDDGAEFARTWTNKTPGEG